VGSVSYTTPDLTGILASLFISSFMGNAYTFAAISVLERRFTLRISRFLLDSLAYLLSKRYS
jgi:hypothetical protein